MKTWMSADLTLRGVWVAIVAACFVTVLAALAVQTARLEGFKVWPFEVEGWKPKAERLNTQIGEVLQASEEAALAARKQRVEKEEHYAEIAERIDHEADTQTSRALVDAERYIAANRVREGAAQNCQCDTGATAKDQSAGGPQGTGPAPELDGSETGPANASLDMVIMSAADVRICTINTVKAEAARDFVMQLEEASETPVQDR